MANANYLLRVLADWNDSIGTIKKGKRFEELDNLTKADLLQGWLYDIENLYNEAVDDLHTYGLRKDEGNL